MKKQVLGPIIGAVVIGIAVIALISLVTTSSDADGDGISNKLDTEPNNPSNQFRLVQSDGSTLSGEILDHAGHQITITTKPLNENHVRITVDDSPETEFVKIRMGDKITNQLPSGAISDFSSGSLKIEVISESVLAEFEIDDNKLVNTTVTENNMITIDPEEMTITADPDNPDNIIATIDSNVVIVVSPGQKIDNVLEIFHSPDADYDGLIDTDEAKTLTDPNNQDTDGDGLRDGKEIIHGTDPNNQDTDGDGLLDGAEVFSHSTDPNNQDTDGDGLLDGAEVNEFGTYPNSNDTDSDGMSDFDEIQNYNTNPFEVDSDYDGLLDVDEVNTHSTDPNNRDTDGDGLLDSKEIDNGTDPLVPN